METEKFDLFGLTLNVSTDHRFGTDAILLARFAKPSKKDIVCDLCTGCGIIPMLFEAWGNCPKKSYGVEIQEEAAELFRKTVEENNLGEKIFPVKADLTVKEELLQIPRESVDMVTVNPPYFKTGAGEERLSPAQAAARHEILCNLEQVIKAAAMLLKYGGSLKICHIPERLTDLLCLMRQYGIEPKIIRFAHNKPEGKPYLVLVSGRKGGKSGVVVEEPMIVGDVNKELFGQEN
ncbi:MAG: methyltransferase [Ruminiclostridium sp.]|nr:methyltransferase [Ruminiclostridium sp.]